MIKIVAVLAFVGVSLCDGQTPQTATSEVPRVYCGEPPSNLFQCLGLPHLVSRDISSKCQSSSTVCDKMKCVYRESQWMTGDTINKQKIKEHFDQLAVDRPSWSQAVNYLKMYCLEHELPPQGVEINCPAYDITHCIEYSFVKNANASQRQQSPQCAHALSYAASCPLCPGACFAPAVPYGSCNACLALPRSP